MDLEKIYHVELLTNTSIINELVEHGWVIIQTGNTHATEDVHNLRIVGQVEVLVGAEKSTFEKFNLDNLYAGRRF